MSFRQAAFCWGKGGVLSITSLPIRMRIQARWLSRSAAQSRPARRLAPEIHAEEKKAARNKVVTEAKPKEPRARDPRLPAVGTTIERLYKGEALRVKVLDEGFLFKGTNYPSLSALAKSLTGCSTNGFLFFQLIERPAKA